MNSMFFDTFLAQNEKLELNYINSRYFRLQVFTTDSLPILIDFGDGVNNSVTHGSTISYDALVLRTSVVKISTPSRLRQIASQIFTGQTAVDWNFSIAKFLICRNLFAFDFRSGNISGNTENLSDNLETFQVLTPSYGLIVGQENQMPTALKILNITSLNASFQHTTSNVGTFMPNLRSYIVSGISKLSGNLASMPPNITNFELRNNGTRRHVISYNTTSGLKTFPSLMFTVLLSCEAGGGLNTAMIDALLIDLAAATWSTTGFEQIRLIEGHGVRSSLSNSAVNTLSVVKGVILQLN